MQMKSENPESRSRRDETYSYKNSIKSGISDELINTYLLRPIAGVVVWALYRTPLTPNQVTIASTLAGLIASIFYFRGEAHATMIAGMLVTLKDVLDSADGQLARARGQYSRTGRFLDSIGDFIVDVALFGAIGWALYRASDQPAMLALALAGLIGISLRVSYHVYYHTSFLHLEMKYGVNRVTEEITEEDRKGRASELALQRVFQLIYGWQDELILRIDEWCREGLTDDESRKNWFADSTGLRISGLLGFGTELFILMLCSVFNRLELYLYINLAVMNGVLVGGILYRRMVLRKSLSSY